LTAFFAVVFRINENVFLVKLSSFLQHTSVVVSFFSELEEELQQLISL
jgi:hypothetical protein